MNIVNAIAKARFASARAQCVHLGKEGHAETELLCLEPGQSLTVGSGQWSYYVLASRATLKANRETAELAPGGFACFGPAESHSLTNHSEQRLICLAFGVR